LADRESRLASALESASLADLAGAGDTGDTTGVVMESSSTTTATFPTAEFSSIATTSIAPEDFMEAERGDSPVANMDSHRMRNRAPIPVHSAASIMEESRGAFLPAGSPALAEASTEEVAVTEAAVVGNPVPILRMQLMIWRENSCAQMI
jgi:hypothetical protein